MARKNAQTLQAFKDIQLTAIDSSLPIRRSRFDEEHRVDWVDYCKGLGIFLVVIGHVLGGIQQSGVISDSLRYRLVEDWLYTFHMPLFFFLSGLFVQRSMRKPFVGFIFDKAAVLVYPYFVWSVLQGILQTSHYANSPISATDLLRIPYVPIGEYWFLYTLFVITIIYRVFYQFTASSMAFFGLTIVCFIAERSGIDVIRWNVAHSVASFLIYFGGGVAIAQNSSLIRLRELGNASLLAIGVGGYAVVTIAVMIGVGAYNDNQVLVWPWWTMAGIVATMAVAILISRSTIFSFVKLWGLLSLEIYVAHVMAAAIFRVILQKAFGVSEPLFHFVLGTGIGIYAPILLAYICPWIGVPYAFTLSRSRLQPWVGSPFGIRSLPSERITSKTR